MLDGGPGSDTASYAERGTAVTRQRSAGSVAEDTVTTIENLTGSSGNDTLTGDATDNALRGGAGNDLLRGGAGNDTLDGGSGSDTATYDERATAVTATLGGSVAEDTVTTIENLTGGSGDDTLTGDATDNTLRGGAGNDTLTGAGGVDVIDGGPGSDTASYAERATAVTATLGGSVAEDTVGAVENLKGSSASDSLTGDAGTNRLAGNGGDDRLVGADGADVLDGGSGRDQLFAGAGDDRLLARDGFRDARLDCGPGIDTVDADPIVDDATPRQGCEITPLATLSGSQPTVRQSPNTCIKATPSRSWCGDGRQAPNAKLAGASDVAAGVDGSLVIADTLNNVIRRVRPRGGPGGGTISTLAGTGERGRARPTTSARDATFDAPEGVAVNPGQQVLVADTGNDAIRLIAGRLVATVRVDVPLKAPRDVVALNDGSMLVADSGNHRILRVRPGGQTEVIAGTGRRGFGGDGGPAARALLSSPTQVSITPDGALLIADTGNGAIRRVAPDGSMSTLARGLRQPSGVAVLPAGSALPQGTVIATTASAVVTIAPGGQTTRRAGRATSGFNRDNGPASSVLLKRAGQISVGSAGRIFFADRGNDRVRESDTPPRLGKRADRPYHRRRQRRQADLDALHRQAGQAAGTDARCRRQRQLPRGVRWIRPVLPPSAGADQGQAGPEESPTQRQDRSARPRRRRGLQGVQAAPLATGAGHQRHPPAEAAHSRSRHVQGQAVGALDAGELPALHDQDVEGQGLTHVTPSCATAANAGNASTRRACAVRPEPTRGCGRASAIRADRGARRR